MTPADHTSLLAVMGRSETAKEILKRRAVSLAKRAANDLALEDRIEVVEFRLAGERYALEQQYVREVQVLSDLTPLPGTPAFLRGIINVRGRILPVIDIKKFFDLPESGIADLHMVIVVESEAVEVGILADAIEGVRSLSCTAIQSSLPTLTGIRAQYLKGVTNQHVVILDVAKVLADPALVVNEQPERLRG